MKSITESILSKSQISDDHLLEQIVLDMIEVGNNGKMPDYRVENGELFLTSDQPVYLLLDTDILNSNFRKINFEGDGSFYISFQGDKVENIEIDSKYLNKSALNIYIQKEYMTKFKKCIFSGVNYFYISDQEDPWYISFNAHFYFNDKGIGNPESLQLLSKVANNLFTGNKYNPNDILLATNFEGNDKLDWDDKKIGSEFQNQLIPLLKGSAKKNIDRIMIDLY